MKATTPPSNVPQITSAVKVPRPPRPSEVVEKKVDALTELIARLTEQLGNLSQQNKALTADVNNNLIAIRKDIDGINKELDNEKVYIDKKFDIATGAAPGREGAAARKEPAGLFERIADRFLSKDGILDQVLRGDIRNPLGGGSSTADKEITSLERELDAARKLRYRNFLAAEARAERQGLGHAKRAMTLAQEALPELLPAASTPQGALNVTLGKTSLVEGAPK